MSRILISILITVGVLTSCKVTERRMIREQKREAKLHTLATEYLVIADDTISIQDSTIFIKTNKNIEVIEQDNILTKKDKTEVEFVGSTGIQKSISENSKIPANAGIGVRFQKEYGTPDRNRKVFKHRLELDLSITIASTIDTIHAEIGPNGEVTNKSQFGSSILLPLNSGQSVVLNMKTYLQNRRMSNFLGETWGIECYISASNRVWSIPEEQHNASTIAFNLGGFKEMIPKENLEYFSISFGLDFASRFIFGNVALKRNEQFREMVIGTKYSAFVGLEPNISIRLKDIRASASFPLLITTHPDVDGLTRGQFVTMIKFTGGFPINLK